MLKSFFRFLAKLVGVRIPLVSEIHFNRLEDVRLAMSLGQSPNFVTLYSKDAYVHPLALACALGRYEVARVLLEERGSGSAEADGQSADAHRDVRRLSLHSSRVSLPSPGRGTIKSPDRAGRRTKRGGRKKKLVEPADPNFVVRTPRLFADPEGRYAGPVLLGTSPASVADAPGVSGANTPLSLGGASWSSSHPSTPLPEDELVLPVDELEFVGPKGVPLDPTSAGSGRRPSRHGQSRTTFRHPLAPWARCDITPTSIAFLNGDYTLLCALYAHGGRLRKAFRHPALLLRALLLSGRTRNRQICQLLCVYRDLDAKDRTSKREFRRLMVMLAKKSSDSCGLHGSSEVPMHDLEGCVQVLVEYGFGLTSGPRRGSGMTRTWSRSSGRLKRPMKRLWGGDSRGTTPRNSKPPTPTDPDPEEEIPIAPFLGASRKLIKLLGLEERYRSHVASKWEGFSARKYNSCRLRSKTPTARATPQIQQPHGGVGGFGGGSFADQRRRVSEMLPRRPHDNMPRDGGILPQPEGHQEDSGSDRSLRRRGSGKGLGGRRSIRRRQQRRAKSAMLPRGAVMGAGQHSMAMRSPYGDVDAGAFRHAPQSGPRHDQERMYFPQAHRHHGHPGDGRSPERVDQPRPYGQLEQSQPRRQEREASLPPKAAAEEPVKSQAADRPYDLVRKPSTSFRKKLSRKKIRQESHDEVSPPSRLQRRRSSFDGKKRSFRRTEEHKRAAAARGYLPTFLPPPKKGMQKKRTVPNLTSSRTAISSSPAATPTVRRVQTVGRLNMRRNSLIRLAEDVAQRKVPAESVEMYIEECGVADKKKPELRKFVEKFCHRLQERVALEEAAKKKQVSQFVMANCHKAAELTKKGPEGGRDVDSFIQEYTDRLDKEKQKGKSQVHDFVVGYLEEMDVLLRSPGGPSAQAASALQQAPLMAPSASSGTATAATAESKRKRKSFRLEARALREPPPLPESPTVRFRLESSLSPSKRSASSRWNRRPSFTKMRNGMNRGRRKSMCPDLSRPLTRHGARIGDQMFIASGEESTRTVDQNKPPSRFAVRVLIHTRFDYWPKHCKATVVTGLGRMQGRTSRRLSYGGKDIIVVQNLSGAHRLLIWMSFVCLDEGGMSTSRCLVKLCVKDRLQLPFISPTPVLKENDGAVVFHAARRVAEGEKILEDDSDEDMWLDEQEHSQREFTPHIWMTRFLPVVYEPGRRLTCRGGVDHRKVNLRQYVG